MPVAGVLADGAVPLAVSGSAIVAKEPESIGERLLVYYAVGGAHDAEDTEPYAARAALAAERLKNRRPATERATLPAIMLEPVARLRLDAPGLTPTIELLEDETGATARARASLSRWLGVSEEALDNQLAQRSRGRG